MLCCEVAGCPCRLPWLVPWRAARRGRRRRSHCGPCSKALACHPSYAVRIGEPARFWPDRALASRVAAAWRYRQWSPLGPRCIRRRQLRRV